MAGVTRSSRKTVLKPMHGYVQGLRVHVSHFGYHPDHPKQVVYTGLGAAAFEIVEADSGVVAIESL